MSLARLSTGVAVSVTGEWTPSAGQEQSNELQVKKVTILGENDATVRLANLVPRRIAGLT